MLYCVLYNGIEAGPMTAEQILAYSPNPQTPVRTAPNEPWRPLATCPELMAMLNARQAGDNNTQRIVAGVLALVLGSFGVHYFYIGKIWGGVINILLNLVTCGIWGIINFIQGILILVMSTPEFERKFVHSQSVFPVF